MIIQNVLWIAAVFVAFAVVHSLTAGRALPDRLKASLDSRLVEGWYRLAYNAFSFVTFAPVMLAVAILPDVTLYSADQTLAIALRVAQLLALGGLAWALWSIDFLRFAGLRQVWAYLTVHPLPLPDEALQQRGVYAIMRHPLYVFSLVVLWASPVMTLNGMIFNGCATLYFAVGSLIEERRLARAFGDTYHAYRRDVAWVISWPRRR
jgi:protein-S-isoprenylcysteine O-methyltransferase Ste14